MNFQDHANALREAADALEDAQRALNHLDALAESWYENTDDYLMEGVLAARARLDGTWRDKTHTRGLVKP